MINNPLVLQAIQDIFNERFEQELKELENKNPHSFSKNHNKKMTKLIKRQKKPYFKLICTTGRRAACIIVAVLVISVSTLSIKAIREAVFDFIMKIFSDHTVITTESGTDSGYPETIEEEYYISELPEGFVEVDYSKIDLSVDVTYFNNDDFIFFSQYTKSYYKETFDNEQTEYLKYVDKNGQEYLYSIIENDKTYIWDNGFYILKISSNLDKDDILKLCKSTKIKF